MLYQLNSHRTFNQSDVMQQLSGWYSSKNGIRHSKALNALMREWLNDEFGHCVLEMSSLPDHEDWMESAGSRAYFRLGSTKPSLMADFETLPIDACSLDLVIVCHVLEFVKDPHCLLREIQRVLVPQGRCIIVSFNPLGLQGVVRPIRLFKSAPWNGHFYSLSRIKDWLSVLGFSIEKSCWFSPPFVVPGDRLWQRYANLALIKSLFWMGSFSALYAYKQVSQRIQGKEILTHQSFLKSKIAQPTGF